MTKNKGSPSKDNDMCTLTKSEYDALMETRNSYQQLTSHIAFLKNKEAEQNAIINDFKAKIDTLVKKISELENSQNSETKIVYETDEDELEMEINPSKFTRQSSKRRKLPNNGRKETETATADQTKKSGKIVKPPLPPPINVSNFGNFNKFKKEIIAKAETAQFKATSANDLKITVQNERVTE